MFAAPPGRTVGHLNSSMLGAGALLLLSAGFVYWACEYFVNALEWGRPPGGHLPKRRRTVLAAFVHRSSPKASVTPPLSRSCSQRCRCRRHRCRRCPGGPLVLGHHLPTQSWRHAPAHPRLSVQNQRYRRESSCELSRDQSWFMLIFAFNDRARLSRLVHQTLARMAIFGGLRGLHLGSRWQHEGDAPEGRSGAMKFQSSVESPGWAMVAVQTLLALGVIFGHLTSYVAQTERRRPLARTSHRRWSRCF